MHRSHLRPIILLLWIAACSSPTTPPAKTPVPGTPTPAETPTPDPSEHYPQYATELGEFLGSLYQQARNSVGRSGSARYLGQGYGTYMQISVSPGGLSAGFDDFQFLLDCDVPQPPQICSAVRAFPPEKVSQAKGMLERLGVKTPLQLQIDGKADPVWNARRKPDTYGGQCGEGSCTTESGSITLASGMTVSSNEILACLRALCSQSETGLGGDGMLIKLRGRVEGKGSAEGQRRAEIGLVLDLPADYRNLVWDSFLRTVGHK